MTTLPILFGVTLVSAIALPGSAAESGVRPAAVAGRFYPDDAAKLRAAVHALLSDAVPPRGQRPIAIVVPHAGYAFSGQIAADAFRQAAGTPPDVVVILGTNHTVPPFDGVSVFLGSGYRTPLGIAAIDSEMASALTAADRAFAFRPDAHAKEHSEEVQVPFVQVLFPKAKIVTAVVGTSNPAVTSRFGNALAKVLAGKNALIVASSDLSHYPSYDDAVQNDASTLRAIAALDPVKFAATIEAQERSARPNLVTSACGEAPILVAMVAARALGAHRGVVISYASSGDSPAGDLDRVVGYGAVMFITGQGAPDTKALERPAAAPKSAPLTASDKAELLKLARTTLERWYRTGTLPLPRSTSPSLRRKQGAFVTLSEHGQLRGCIGVMSEETPLQLTVSKMVLQAAMQDPRFPPVRADELPSVEIEISALTPMMLVSGPEAIQVGRDGVMIEKGGRRAVFLPQVAPEQGWSRDEMLDNLCMKAGLPEECWRSGARFSTFQADVFGEPKR